MKTSTIWKYFRVSVTDSSKAICNLCQKHLSRGGAKSKGFSTSNLFKHLESKHVDKYRLLTKNEHNTGEPPIKRFCNGRFSSQTETTDNGELVIEIGESNESTPQSEQTDAPSFHK